MRSNLDDERANKEDDFDSKIKELMEIEVKFTATIEHESKVQIFPTILWFRALRAPDTFLTLEIEFSLGLRKIFPLTLTLNPNP